MKPYNILVAGWIGSENMGDEAIFAALLSSIRDLPVKVTAFSVDERRTRKLFGVDTAPFEVYINALRFMQAIRNADLVLVGGGGILQDQTSIFNTPRYLYKALLGVLLRKTVIFYAVGVGPIVFSITKLLVRLILNRCNRIIVRDERSKALLISVGVREQLVDVSFDPSIRLIPTSREEARSFLGSMLPTANGKKIIAVCLRDWYYHSPFLPVALAQRLRLVERFGSSRNNSVMNAIAVALDSLSETGKYNIVFVPFCFSRDTKVHNDVIRRMTKGAIVASLPYELGPTQLLGLFGCFDAVIAMRLHACIFAAIANTPFIALQYSTKVDDFLCDLNAGIEGTSLESLQPSDIITQIEYIDKEGESIRNALAVSKQRAIVREARNREAIREAVKSRGEGERVRRTKGSHQERSICDETTACDVQ